MLKLFEMRKGFSLIELLISLSIIGILALIALVLYTGFTSNARDSVRKNDLKTLATALELYNQKNSKYFPPIIDSTNNCTSGGDTSSFYTAIASFIHSGSPPVDPKTGIKYCYIALNDGASYRLYAKLEKCNGADLQIALVCSAENWSTKWNYSITSDNITITPAP